MSGAAILRLCLAWVRAQFIKGKDAMIFLHH
jgi:hypothetical protein